MHHDKIFRLAGAYRHLVTVAKNVRIAPVHASEDKTPAILRENSENEDLDGEVDDVIYDTWSYNRENEKKSSKSKYENENENVRSPVIVDTPHWMRIKESSFYGEHSSKTIENPFSLQVEKLWENNILPNLLFQIYSGSSSATHSKNIGLLPSVLSNTIIPSENIPLVTVEEDNSKEKIGKKAGKKNVEDNIKDNIVKNSEEREAGVEIEVEGIRISFSLCASTYATTYLDHLSETINRK